ncbi:DUF6525 family protein [Pseudomonas sp. GX19020]|uniref:DUF6525 family protein n=1 Tax=Pseudomonas sp. GX19020 TaxID=2942277 RepID=UPI002019C614|nr:DUF6525 family protein [Pseudomonas sp. GX19020]MCL4066007.1 DUF6525 family protein [Pseudomonas sp. GX19020]
MGRNLVTSLRGRARPRPMERFDRLPPDLRRWLSQAVLPWSPHSALRLWTRLGRETGGDLARMLERLNQAEQRLISRDALVIWGSAAVGSVVAGGAVSCLDDPVCTRR